MNENENAAKNKSDSTESARLKRKANMILKFLSYFSDGRGSYFMDD
jgi:hypothetical protein